MGKYRNLIKWSSLAICFFQLYGVKVTADDVIIFDPTNPDNLVDPIDPDGFDDRDSSEEIYEEMPTSSKEFLEETKPEIEVIPKQSVEFSHEEIVESIPNSVLVTSQSDVERMDSSSYTSETTESSSSSISTEQILETMSQIEEITIPEIEKKKEEKKPEKFEKKTERRKKLMLRDDLITNSTNEDEHSGGSGNGGDETSFYLRLITDFTGIIIYGRNRI